MSDEGFERFRTMARTLFPPGEARATQGGSGIPTPDLIRQARDLAERIPASAMIVGALCDRLEKADPEMRRLAHEGKIRETPEAFLELIQVDPQARLEARPGVEIGTAMKAARVVGERLYRPVVLVFNDREYEISPDLLTGGEVHRP